MKKNITDINPMIKAEQDGDYPFLRNSIEYTICIRYRRFTVGSKAIQYGLQIYNNKAREYENIGKNNMKILKTKGDVVKYLINFYKKK